MAEIKLENITYLHGKDTPYQILALDNVSLSIPSGKITGIIGHTGSGKSTLVQMLNGILKPHEGSVKLDEKDIWEKPKEIRKIRFRVGLVMQYPEYQLFEETVYKDIAFGPKNMGLSDDDIRERVLEAAEFAGVEKELLEKSPFDLSGGQKRRVAIAGIIAMRPDVLVLDEPAAGLDPRGRESIFSNIVEYQKKSQSTVVIVSHSMEDMARFCDDVVVMSGARVIMHGACNEVFSNMEQLSDIGLDIPQITHLMNLLKNAGIDIPNNIYTVDAAVEAVRSLFEKRR